MSWLERTLAQGPYEQFLNVPMGGWADDDLSRLRDVLLEEHMTLIDDVDLTEPSYSFHFLRFWVRKSDGMVLYATDSGCSCPSPFEGITLAELKETSLARVADVARDLAATGGRSTAEIVRDATALIPAMKKAGAR